MHTFEIEAEIDLDNYRPDLNYSAQNLNAGDKIPWRVYVGEMKKLAVRLARYGVKGKDYPYKGERIINVIRDKFPPNIERLPSRTAVDDWIAGVDYVGDEVAYSPDLVLREWRSYVARLSMVSEFWHQRPLNGNEAKEAQYVGNEFQDPFGKEVDLIPQLAVVRQITEYRQLKNDSLLKTLENYFKFAPWKFGVDFFPEGLGFPIIKDFILTASESENFKEVSPVFEDALRQLGISYSYCYSYVLDDGRTEMTLEDFPAFGDESKGACSWTEIVKSTRHVPSLPNYQATFQSDRITPDAYRGWDTSEKWKQITRITYKEIMTND